MAGDERDPAAEHEYHRSMVALTLRAGPSDPYQYRMGFFDALTAARWAARAGDDHGVVEALTLAAQLTAAVVVSVSGDGSAALPIGDEVRPVPAGLPVDALNLTQWSDGMWAALAAGDAASGVRIAVADPDTMPSDAPADVVATARLIAGLWRGEPAGPLLVAALEATDPAGRTSAEADRLLDLAVPPLRVLRHLLAGDRSEVTGALADAGADHVRYWSRHPDDKVGYLSLPLSGLARLATAAGVDVAPVDGAIPARVVEAPPDLVACPICAQPRDEVETTCTWCGADLTADAPLELPFSSVLDESVACPDCGTANRPTALRCRSCSASLPSA